MSGFGRTGVTALFVWSKLTSTSAILSAIRVGGSCIAFVTQILLARLLAPAELGVFFFVTSMATIASLVVGHGYPSLMARFISRYTERNQPGYLSAFLRTSQKETLKWSILGAALFALVAWYWPNIDDDTRLALVFGALTIVPMGMHRILGYLAITYRRFVIGYLPQFIIRPAMFVVVIGALYLFNDDVSVWSVTAIQFATWFAMTFATLYIVRNIYLGPGEPVYDRRLTNRWRREAWPLVIVASFTGLLSELAVVFVAPFMSMEDVAAFGICIKLAFLVGFVVQIAHQVILPDMGEALARRESSAIRGRILSASLMPLALTVGGVLFSMLFGDWFLMLFGAEFSSAKSTLTILMLAQLARAIAGPSSLLLTLKGAQTASAWICAVSAVVLLATNAVFATLWGAEGGALAVLVTTIVWLGMTGIALYRIDGARADILGLLSRRHAAAPAE
jgi:O-antigen/teichoic acid export membrane protein